MRDLILRLCLRAYPAEVRRQDGVEIIDLARDLSAEGRFSILREAAALLWGGMGARGKSLRLDVADAPWGAARRRLVLPLAVMMFCLILAFALSSWSTWIGWWASLALVATAAAVVGAATGRRRLTVAASCVVAGLMVFDALRELSTHNSRWIGDVGIGSVNVFGLWLPIALLLLICSGAIVRPGAVRGRLLMGICVPIVASAVLALALRTWSGTALWWSGLDVLGGVFTYVPPVFTAGVLLQGAIRRGRAARTAGSLLVAMVCLPVLWLLAMVVFLIPTADELISSFSYFPLVYFGIGVLLTCVVIRLLLGRRVQIGA